MKPNTLSRHLPGLAFLLGIAMPLLAPLACAQVEGAPGYVDYQGTVFDGGTGDPLGSPTPENRTMEFRIYGAQTGGVPVWGETQTVTVSEGQFSVRLGAGAPIAGEPASVKSGAEIADVFGMKSRFLELTVIPTGQTTGTPILPRLAFQSSPFSFVAGRARLADEVNGKVTATAGSTFAGTVTGTVTGNVTGNVAGDVTGDVTGNVTGNVTGTAANVTGTVAVANGGTGSTTKNFVDLTSSQTNIGGTKRFTGDVGVGTLGPAEDFHVSRGDSDIARIYATGETQGGGMIYAGARTSYGGGFLHESSTSNVTGFAGFHTVFFRRDAGVDTEVFSYPYNSNNVEFEGTIYAPKIGVGIGTNTPKAPLEVSGFTNRSLTSIYLNNLGAAGYTYYNNLGNGGNGDAHVPLLSGTNTRSVSIYASNDMAATGFAAFSDARIKRIKGRSDAGRDLATLLDIEVTDYTHIDTIAKGTGREKKVVAQQVEKVFPQSVNQSTDVVPDIMSKAKLVDGWVQAGTDLKKGERVRLIGAKEEGVHEVLEVRDGAFRTAFKASTDEVFVYGREVKDFRTVDYDAIAMLNVSATQELHRFVVQQGTELASKTKQISHLEQRLAALEQRDQERDARLARLEKLLQGESGTLPVSSQLSSVK